MNPYGIELQAGHCGLNIKRQHLQLRLELHTAHGGILHAQITTPAFHGAAQLCTAGYESLHEESVGGIDVRLQGVQALRLQGIGKLSGPAVTAAINADNRGHGEIPEVQLTKFNRRIRTRKLPGRIGLIGPQKKYAPLTVYQDTKRPPVGGKPVFQFHTSGAVAPVAGQQEAADGLYAQTDGLFSRGHSLV